MPLWNLFRQRITINPRSTTPSKSGYYGPSGNTFVVNGRYRLKKSWVLIGGDDISRLTNIVIVEFPASTSLSVGDYITLPTGETRVVREISTRCDGIGNPLFIEAIT